MIILYYSGFFFSFNIYSAELPTLLPHQSKQEYPQLSVKRLSTGSSVPQGKVHLRGTDGRQNTATDKRPFLTCTPGPGCQALPPTLAQCEWPWKMGKDRDSSLSSSCMNGPQRLKDLPWSHLKSLSVGLTALGLQFWWMEGMELQWELQWQRQPSSVTCAERPSGPNLSFRRLGKRSPREVMGLKT